MKTYNTICIGGISIHIGEQSFVQLISDMKGYKTILVITDRGIVSNNIHLRVLKQLEEEGKHWRFVATMDHGKADVSLKEIGKDSPFYNLAGSNNIVLLTTERYREYPMLIQGYGAGASVTAAGVFANIMSIANI